jgi:hypothetical protein
VRNSLRGQGYRRTYVHAQLQEEKLQFERQFGCQEEEKGEALRRRQLSELCRRSVGFARYDSERCVRHGAAVAVSDLTLSQALELGWGLNALVLMRAREMILMGVMASRSADSNKAAKYSR